MVLVPLAFAAGAAVAFVATQWALRSSRERREREYATSFIGQHDQLEGLEREAERWAARPLTGNAAADELDDAVRRSVQSAIDETRRRLHPPPSVLIRVKP